MTLAAALGLGEVQVLLPGTGRCFVIQSVRGINLVDTEAIVPVIQHQVQVLTAAGGVSMAAAVAQTWPRLVVLAYGSPLTGHRVAPPPDPGPAIIL